MDIAPYDLVVIGAGSGGVRCARIAAQLGARVACIEGRFWGGTCVNVGCVPKKLYVLASEYASQWERAKGFGWDIATGNLQWPLLQAKVTREVHRLSALYDQLLANAGVDRYWGQASIDSEKQVLVAGHRLQARHIVIATGSKPLMPEFEGTEYLLDSDAFFTMGALPRRAVVIGGGYIAVELAGILSAAGAQTTLVYRGDLILRGFDDDIRRHLQEMLPLQRVRVITQATVQRIANQDDTRSVILSTGETLPADAVIAATGRTPNSAGLGLEALGVATTDTGAVRINTHFETSVPGIYAVGDVTGGKQLTPVALAEGMYVAHRLFGEMSAPIRYDTLATAVFSQPAVACVGLTEAQCRERGRPFKIFRSRFKPMSQSLSAENVPVFLKVLVDTASDEVLGIHMVGDNAGEIIQGFAAAMTCHMTKRQMDRTLGIHPTVAEELVTLRTVSEHVTP